MGTSLKQITVLSENLIFTQIKNKPQFITNLIADWQEKKQTING